MVNFIIQIYEQAEVLQYVNRMYSSVLIGGTAALNVTM